MRRAMLDGMIERIGEQRHDLIELRIGGDVWRRQEHVIASLTVNRAAARIDQQPAFERRDRTAACPNVRTIVPIRERTMHHAEISEASFSRLAA